MPDAKNLSNAVFISYRRQASEDLAYAIYQGLKLRQIDPFFDYQSIPAGRWLETILRQIAARPYFLLVLAPGTLDRCADPGDILRREIQEAVTLDRVIVPLTTYHFDRADVSKYLPPTLARTINDFQGLDLPSSRTYYEAAFDRLRDGYLHPIPLVVTPPPATDLPMLRDNQVKVDQVAPPQQFTLPLLEWLIIPAGKVTLEKGYVDSEHDASSGKTYSVDAFQIAKYPVTYAQFEAFLADGGYANDQYWQGLARRIIAPADAAWAIDNHPREMVNWFEATAFCRWLSEKTGRAIILPTEMQWQRAAQGDDDRRYPWGNQFDKNKCNTEENGFKKTTPVERYPAGASPYGVIDMSGNVWEWTQTDYEHPDNHDLNVVVPRASRGGSWLNGWVNTRTSHRGRNYPYDRSRDLGFRVVCSVPVF